VAALLDEVRVGHLLEHAVPDPVHVVVPVAVAARRREVELRPGVRVGRPLLAGVEGSDRDFATLAGNSMTLFPELPAAATTTTPSETARSIAVFTVWLKLSLPRLRLMTLTGCTPLSVYSVA
jgi:hypothetical protein